MEKRFSFKASFEVQAVDSKTKRKIHKQAHSTAVISAPSTPGQASQVDPLFLCGPWEVE